MILHLTAREDWERAPAHQPYCPESLVREGFIHATQGDALLLEIANRFYRHAPGEFIVLEIDESRLTSPLRWEAPAPPHGAHATPADAHRTFPHIYGPLNREAIIGVRRVLRAEDGQFIGYAPLQ